MNCQPNVRGFSRKDVIPELFHALMKVRVCDVCSLCYKYYSVVQNRFFWHIVAKR